MHIIELLNKITKILRGWDSCSNSLIKKIEDDFMQLNSKEVIKKFKYLYKIYNI